MRDKKLVKKENNTCASHHVDTLKTELVDDEDYRTREQARQSLFEYIEVFYNRKQSHSTLGYQSSVQFMQDWISTQSMKNRKHETYLLEDEKRAREVT